MKRLIAAPGAAALAEGGGGAPVAGRIVDRIRATAAAAASV